MSKINLVIFDDAEKWLRENLPLLGTDTIAAVHPTTEFRPGYLTGYKDEETGKKATRDMSEHVEALQKLCSMIGRTLFVGGLKNPFELTDPGNWDVEVADAYFQLVMLGEVVYG